MSSKHITFGKYASEICLLYARSKITLAIVAGPILVIAIDLYKWGFEQTGFETVLVRLIIYVGRNEFLRSVSILATAFPFSVRR